MSSLVNRGFAKMIYGVRISGKLLRRDVWRLENVRPDDFHLQKALHGNRYSMTLTHDPRLHQEGKPTPVLPADENEDNVVMRIIFTG
jgi:hypothetical protein